MLSRTAPPADTDGVVGSVDCLLTIQQVSRLLDVPAPTLRSWERRYDVPVARRSSGGHRRYSDAEVELLRRMRDAIDGGSRAFAAADLVKQHASESPAALIDDFLAAVQQFQARALERVLDFSRTCLGLDRTVDDVLVPALHELGTRWQLGRSDVANEHLATEVVRGWLARITPADGQPRLPRPVVLSCGPRDQHTLGLESFAALLTSRGADCRVLGARTPVESLARAVQATCPGAVVLVSHLPGSRRDAVAALQALPTGVPVFYAGRAFESRQSRAGVPGQHLGDRLSSASELVADELREPAGS